VGYRLSRRVRTAALAASLIGAAVIIPSVAGASPGTPTPQPPSQNRINSVQQRLTNLSHQNDQLVEKYNQTNIAYQSAQRDAAKAEGAYHAAVARLSKAQQEFASAAAAQYEGGAFSSTGALLSSDSGQSYLSQLDTLSMLSSHNAQVVSTFTATQKQAEKAKQQANAAVAQAKTRFAAVTTQRKQTKVDIAKYTNLLARLNAQQRAAWAAQTSPTVPQSSIDRVQTVLPHATPAQVRTAIKFALAQQGKPYVWGSAGPSSYDCSGLTMASYSAAGISLPHSAAAQYNYGHHVSFDQLEPGDLMFFYQPIGHVTMYIGNGLMVSAPQTGEDVKVIPANTFGSDFVGATRLVG
jgi:cell wall-associated NlpC family hydrolase